MIPDLRKAYIETGKAKIVFHDFPWIGEESVVAAQGAHCAAGQNRFWPFHDLLYNNQRGENQGQFAKPKLVGFAGQAGLDAAAFSTCLDQGALLAPLRAQPQALRAQGISGTPTILVNGRQTAPTLDALSRAIDAALK